MAEQEIFALRTRFLMQLDIEGETPRELGHTYRGRRRIVSLAGGAFHGPRLNGAVEKCGADFALVRPDGVFEIDVRAVLACDDGAQIYLQYQGLWHAEPATMERLLRREGDLDPTAFYLRTTCKFETSHADYLWLNRIVAVANGFPRMGTKSGMSYQIHEIL